MNITPERAFLAAIFIMLWAIFIFGPVLMAKKR